MPPSAESIRAFTAQPAKSIRALTPVSTGYAVSAPMPLAGHALGRDRGCQLLCVPPDKVALIWPRVSGLILAAMKRGDLSSFEPVESSVLSGHALLWLAVTHEDGREHADDARGEQPGDGTPRVRRDGDGVQVHAAAVTELHQTEWRKVCVIVACGGKEMGRWLDLIGPIEEFARAEQCSAVRIMGRMGWTRVLPTYRPKRIVLEKEL